MASKDQGVDTRRYTVIPRVLCFITHGNDVLLIKGAPTKRIWANKYNGIGGHVEAGEDILNALYREIDEETGLKVQDTQLKGIIMIDTGKSVGINMFVFTAEALHRDVVESAEGTLEWVPIDGIQERDLVEDLPLLIPKVLAMQDQDPPFSGRYWYDEADRLQIAW